MKFELMFRRTRTTTSTIEVEAKDQAAAEKLANKLAHAIDMSEQEKLDPKEQNTAWDIVSREEIDADDFEVDQVEAMEEEDDEDEG